MAKKMKGVTSITRNGATYWYAQVDGRRVYCGKGDKGRKLAEAARSKYVGRKYENREVQAGLKTRRAEFRTVRDLLNWYMLILSVQARKNYRCRIGQAKHLLEFFGDLPVGAVDGDQQERYRQHRAAADGTINNDIRLLSAAYHRALRDRKILPEQAPGQFIMNGSSNPRRIVTDEEFECLLAHTEPDFRDFLVTGYESAMRLSEIAGLTAGQVHLDVQHISGEMVDYIDLGIFDTKAGVRRTIPVSARLKEILKGRLQELGPDDRLFRVKKVWAKMEAACKAAEIPYGDKALNAKGERIGVVFHCLRHTRISKWVEMGFSDEIIRRASGHASLEAYRTYVKLDPSVVMRLVRTDLYTNSIKTPQIRAAGY